MRDCAREQLWQERARWRRRENAPRAVRHAASRAHCAARCLMGGTTILRARASTSPHLSTPLPHLTNSYKNYGLTALFKTSTDKVEVTSTIDNVAPGLKAAIHATLPDTQSGALACLPHSLSVTHLAAHYCCCCCCSFLRTIIFFCGRWSRRGIAADRTLFVAFPPRRQAARRSPFASEVAAARALATTPPNTPHRPTNPLASSSPY